MSAAKLPNLLKASACQLSAAKRKVRGIIYFSGSTLTRRSVYKRGLGALYFGASVKRPTALYAAVPAQHDFVVYVLGGMSRVLEANKGRRRHGQHRIAAAKG